ncbi:MAG: DcaP family trimeric outer membrane transporter [Planctomycetota bacterium]
MQRIIEEQQRQLEMQQKQLEAQEKKLQELRQQVQGLVESEKARQGQEAEQQATEPSQPQEAAKHTPPSAEKEKLAREESAFEKLFRDPRIWPEGMKRPDGWISVPGRKTDVRFGGFVQVNFIHDFQNAGFPFGEFITSQILVPTDHSSNTEFDPRTSRLTFETRTPGARDSYYKTFFSIDFDFDLEGPNAMTGTRQGLARYSFTLDEEEHLIADFALEQPETEVQNGNGLRNLPDAVVRINWHQDWGHLTAAALGRQLVAESTSGTGEDSAFAWGLSLSGELKVPDSKDNFRFQVQGGSGIGRYVFDLGSAPTPQDAVYNEATAKLSPLEEFGAFGAYQHFWADKWRSTLVLGYLRMNNQAEQPPDELKQTIYAVGNLIYRLYDQLDFGLEYYWGQRKNKDDETGYANRLMFAVKYPF